ncbi:HAD-IA family hydrolase, partial [Candidatus Bathyarchaeota archaeon]|nr:HAD-IA family hydrolase [Candidatus Bathyarchaeota archaeon]
LEPLYEAYKEAVLTDVYAYEDSVSVLETLKRRGFLLGLISNTTDYESLRDILKKFGMFELFDSIAASVLTLWRKPRREIFMYALSQVDVEPREAVHIGDSLKNDVAGAKSVGMYAVWKVRNKQSLDSMQAPVKPDFVVEKLSEVLDFVELV